jgi:hypothetical protein
MERRKGHLAEGAGVAWVVLVIESQEGTGCGKGGLGYS